MRSFASANEARNSSFDDSEKYGSSGVEGSCSGIGNPDLLALRIISIAADERLGFMLRLVW